jgi:arabinose-5-phosphate isomerase
MRSGERVACVGPDALVQEAVLAMTRVKSGAVAVIGPNQKVLGIFTDGDLRRHIADLEPLVERKISEVMTVNPVSVQEDALAAEILTIYESRQIDDILVLNAEGQLAGLVDIQDLPKFKIL